MIKSGITKRWLLTTILVIALILFCITVGLSLVLKEYYYGTAEEKLQSLCQSSAVADYFSPYLGSSPDVFASRSREYVDNFQDKNTAELWVINKSGEVIVTSTGFMSDEKEMPDYDAALASPTGRAVWTGRLSSGEKVMAFTVLLPLTRSMSNGGVRYMVSLDAVDRQMTKIVILLAAISMFALFLVVSSGMFFIKSIVAPVKNLNDVTRRIAEGNYSQKVSVSNKYDEIAELAESINYMSNEIDKTDRLKNDFISTVSHELRTPLTAIKGWSETLLSMDEVRVDGTVNDGLQVILNETEHLYSLVEDLLDFSKIESGRLSLRLKKTDILAELDEAVFVLRDRAKREGIEIFYSSPDTPAPMNADADRIKQVFVNIIDNAIKYTPEGGNITILASVMPENIRITVTDTGCGIAAADLPRVKEKFYKANLSVKGSGIGLAVSDEIISLHKGKLDIFSTPGKGTKVEITLPLLTSQNANGKEA